MARQTTTGPSNIFFSAFLDHGSTFKVAASAVAVGGGPCSDGCAIPLVILSYALVDGSGNLRCNQPQGFFAPSTIDTVGLTDLNQGPATNPNTGSVAAATANGTTCARTSKVGSELGVQNGNNLNSGAIYNGFRALMYPVGTAIADCPTSVVPVVDMGACPPPNYNQPRPVVGFVRVALLCVKRNGPRTFPTAIRGSTRSRSSSPWTAGAPAAPPAAAPASDTTPRPSGWSSSSPDGRPAATK